MQEHEVHEEKQEQKDPLHRRIVHHSAFLPVVLFLGIVIVFSVSSRFSDRPPVIENITPSIGNPGDVLVITGQYFGDSRQGGEVHIAGTRPTSSSYIEWTDTRISVRIPPNVGSGLVYVITRDGKSEGVLFTNREHIPVVLEGPSKPGYPYISDISPTKGSVGTLITIEGLNFGMDRGNSDVYFTPLLSEVDTENQDDESFSMLPATDNDYDYSYWSDREIRVYVPDGVTSGNIKVSTDRGMSNAAYFEVTEPVGTKFLKQKRGYQIQYGVTIDEVSAEAGNSLYVWLPKVYKGLHQRNMEHTSEPKPYWENFQGVHVYLLEGLEPMLTYNVTQTTWFERYTVETQIQESNVPSEYNSDRKLYQVYTSQDEFVPAENEKISQLAKRVVGRIRNPYSKARAIYDYIIDTFSFTTTPSETDIVKSLNEKEGDSYIYALLFTSMLRSVGVPSRPIAGYVVYGNKRTQIHHWSEFYVSNFGWVPVDCVLGDGGIVMDIPQVEDKKEYYFGNIDNQHIAFSRGIIKTNRVLPNGRIRKKQRLYSFQHIHEEASENIENYRSVWKDVKIVDWW
jgi:hypothetical protein